MIYEDLEIEEGALKREMEFGGPLMSRDNINLGSLEIQKFGLGTVLPSCVK